MEYTHLVWYGGKVIEATVTDRESVARKWVEHVKYRESEISIVGLNCKWSPYPLRSITNPAATLQLCVDTTCLILQLRPFSGLPHSVARFLSNPNLRFVGLEAEAVKLKLEDEYGLRLGSKAVDVRSLAKMHLPLSYHSSLGLKALAARLLALPPIEPTSLPWKHLESSVLDDQAVKTACVDTYVSSKIGYMLLKQI